MSLFLPIKEACKKYNVSPEQLTKIARRFKLSKKYSGKLYVDVSLLENVLYGQRYSWKPEFSFSECIKNDTVLTTYQASFFSGFTPQYIRFLCSEYGIGYLDKKGDKLVWHVSAIELAKIITGQIIVDMRPEIKSYCYILPSEGGNYSVIKFSSVNL